MAVKGIKFFAEWCGPCKVVGSRLKDVDIESVNIEVETELARKYQIKNLPTIVFVKDDEVVDRFTGLVTKEQYLQKLNELNGGSNTNQ